MLRSLRTDKGLSQQQLADMLHVDRSTIASWETGRRVPDAVMISQLSSYLGSDIEMLLSLSEKRTEPPQVILLDDEKIILNGGIPVLKQTMPGAEIHGFTVPSRALDYAKEHRVALVFLDIEMGRISGLDVCQDFLRINPRTNVIFLTAYKDYSYDAWATGACGFMIKPLLAENVKSWLSRLRYPISGLTSDINEKDRIR